MMRSGPSATPGAFDRLLNVSMLLVGGINFDFNIAAEFRPPTDGTAQVDSLSTSFGGHAGNCAAALARLGVGVSLFGAVGDDTFGCDLLADFRQAGVRTEHVSMVGGLPTGTAFVCAFGDERFMLLHRGANLWEELPDRLEQVPLRTFDCVLVFDAPRAVMTTLTRLAEETKAKTIWSPGGIISRETWHRETLRHVDALILNRTEAQDMFGTTSAANLDMILRDLKPEFRLIITSGRDGARALTRDGETRVPAFEVGAVDPTGAGDAFTAGFAVCAVLGLDLDLGLRVACMMGGLATRAVGSRSALPTLPELTAHLAQSGVLV